MGQVSVIIIKHRRVAKYPKKKMSFPLPSGERIEVRGIAANFL
jgi:hypothetical protein